MGRSIWRNRQLIAELARREVVGRYKGSFLGITWSLFYPIVMLAIYTLVFSGIFNARWGVAAEQSHSRFAIILFVGLMVQGLFAEVVNRAPMLVVGNVNYVKKVVFPLEILPVVSIVAALFHACVSAVVLLGASVVLNGSVPWTAIFLPLVLLPLALVVLGVAWALASLGVFLRDVGHTIGLVTTGMMFLAPVFYPASAVPPAYRSWLMANPLTFIIEQARDVVIWGRLPDWSGLGLYTLAALAVGWAGYAWFQKTRKGFADVL